MFVIVYNRQMPYGDCVDVLHPVLFEEDTGTNAAIDTAIKALCRKHISSNYRVYALHLCPRLT